MTSPQYDVHVQFLQDILLQYMFSQTVPTENRIEMKTKKEIHFSLFYFHFNYIVDRHNATALARDKHYCGNGVFFKLLVMNREIVKTALIIEISDFFFKRINKHKNQTKLYK